MKIDIYSPTIRRKEMDAVLTAMVEDRIGPGEQAKFLVQTAKEKIRFDYCLSLRSPAIALYLALKALDLKAGQGVLVSALSPVYYSRIIKALGLVPVYCDVFSGTAVMSRETVEKALAGKAPETDVRCIVLHHTLGYLPDGAAIAETGIPVIEDCSASYGTFMGEAAPEIAAKAESAAKAEIAEKASTDGAEIPPVIPAGSCGVFTILGLEERDMLTSGGGALLYAMNRRDASVLRNFGELPAEYGLPDMNAALAVVQFREAAKNLQKRREIARLYTQSALRTRHRRFIQNDAQNPKAEKDAPKLPVEYNNFAFAMILETGMKDVKAYARRKEIAVESAFDNTLTGSGIAGPEDCPEAYSLSLRTAVFPLYPRLKLADAEKVAKLILTLP